MLQISALISNHIRFLLQSLNDSNSESIFRELSKFIDGGTEGSILILKNCLDYIDIYGSDIRNLQPHPVFVSLFKSVLDKPNFSTVFGQSLRSGAIREGFLDNLSNVFSLSVSDKIAVGLALSESENPDTRMCGKNFCMTQIEGLFANPSVVGSTEQVQNIYMFLHRSEGLSKHVDTFTRMLSLVQYKEHLPFILAPFISDELDKANILSENDFDAVVAEMESEISMADVMKELGYGCTIDASKCKEVLSLFLPLTELTLSRILGTIARTRTGLEDNQNTFTAFLSAIGSSSIFDLPSVSSWNIGVLVDSVKELAPDINWISVMQNLDHEGFYIPSEGAFTYFMSIYKHACQDPFPLNAVCGSTWKNTEGQLSFLKYAVSAPPEVFTFSHSVRQLANVDAVHGFKTQLGNSNHAWLCLDLLNVLCQLAERGHATAVQSMLEYPLKHCPDVLLLGMGQIHTAYNLLQYEVSSSVFPTVVVDATRTKVILNLWHINPSLVLRGLVDVLTTDPESIPRILDICQEMKILNPVLEMIPFSFAIRLATIASQKELLDLEKWLSDNLSTFKDIFFEECLKYLKEIQFILSQQDTAKRFHSSAITSFYSRTISTFLKVLQTNSRMLTSSHLAEEMEKLHISLMHSNLGQENDGVTDSSNTNGYGDDIESEVNSYYQRMFAEELTVDEMVQMLGRFKESSEKREQSIFDCVVSNLFEEYRFFPKYPERQLGLAAILFGSLIKNQLVTHLTLGIALRGVLDALRKPADSKMFAFGTKALEQFISRLHDWPQYCNHILQISHLRGTHPELVAYIEEVLARMSHGGNGAPVDQLNISAQVTAVNEFIGSNNPQIGQQLSSPLPLQSRNQISVDDENKASGSINNFPKPLLSSAAQATIVSSGDAVITQKIAVSASSMLSSSPGFTRPSRGITSTLNFCYLFLIVIICFGSLNIETLVAAAERRETPIEAPSSDIQDKVSFIVNNISAANIEAKAKEFSEILKEQYYPWFAQYMVMKRASIEPNFHELYLKFLDKFNSKSLNKEIVQATYENCKVLLGSELIKSSSEERSLLKNLGSWLGKLTIGRNQVLRARDIDPKSLIIEAYEKGLMIAVIPFTSKILEPCQSSLAYQPPNPWTMGILALLVEIYAMPNLKMNLKFDIEVLFKNLGVNMKDVTPTSLLKDRVRVVEGNPDFSNKDIGAPQPAMVAEDKSGVLAAPNQVELPLEVAAASYISSHPHSISPYAGPGSTLIEDDKLAAIGFSDQLPSAQGLLQATASQSPYSMAQLPSSIPSIGAHVVVNQKLSALGLHLHFQRVLPIAMERAIKEIVPSVVQRSVSIATQTTKELVIKDYALESDESRIYNAAHLMVASLAGSLAHVTCKEPLRGSISSQLRNMLQGLNIGAELLEQAIQLVTNDNLDLGCAIIEQAATEKAVQTIDDEITHQLSLRRKHRESLGSSIYDSSVYAQGSMGVLPETLRPKPGRLSLSQQRVYEDFVRLPWQNQQSSQSTSATLTSPSPSSGGVSLSRAYNTSSGQLNPGVYSSGLGNMGFGVVTQPLDIVAEESESTSAQILSVAPSNHIRTVDGVQQRSEIDSVTASSPSTVSVPDNAIQESGVPSHAQPLASAAERVGPGVSEQLTTGEALEKYQIVALKLEALLVNEGREAEIQSAVSEVPQIILRSINRDEVALAVAQKVLKALYENASNSFYVGAHLAILAAIHDVSKLVVKELTGWVIYSDEEWKFNKDITVGLIRRELLNLAEYNIHMAKLLDAGRNKAATEFVISLLQALLIEEPKVISELQTLVDSLAKLAARPGSPESLQQLVEIARNPTATVAALSGINVGKEDKTRQARDRKAAGQSSTSRGDYNNVELVEVPDASGFYDQVSSLFADWFRICELPAGNDAASTNFILQLHQNGLLKGDETSDRFFRILLEISVKHCLASEMRISGPLQSSQQVQSLSFLAIDICAKLVFSILKYFPVDQGTSRLFLLPKVLAVTVRFIQKDADDKKSSFNPRPYFRLFINWLLDIGSLDPVHDGVNFQVLTAFANAFHTLQPLKVPAFSFAWLELVSHRTFMPKLLTGNSQKGWPYLHRLLVDLFQFMEPFLRNAELGELIRFLYKGTLRVLLVLLHDFPEFLCDYHFTFCDVIPASCIQMRNIILSAFPRNMRLPDPSTPNLKIDLLAEMSQAPRILSEIDATLKAKQMKADVDEYLKTRQQGSSFLSDLKQRLLLSQNDSNKAGTRYNVPLINSLVLYVGMLAIQHLQPRNPPQQQSVSNSVLVDAALDIFQILIMDLDTEGRYLFLNAVANQLRYPNNHTHYFSFILLYLFSEANQEIIQEQITRVLLERLIVNRPHPWGLLITFIELIKNPRYNFWNRSFTRCAPEIEKLFESVSRSCGGPKPVNDGMSSGGLSDTTH
ncbi:hypothetical protein Nepgr_002460 [Nepenthes gracilis]|uniref:CCR4-NOT transcription complex subunit 1 n=1 Tax=Nepenthes gracilis TaxID=150966 RepID=A0AAD3RYA3_NEPGR|nr:hypothetical protein Nepgr_002460 [Nepenthes gracilis]